MIRARRFARVAAFLALLCVAILIVAVVATQTPWFKDWLRRYVTREASAYLHGELAITRLSGNLFTGIELEGVTLTQEGRTVLAIKDLGVDYNALDFVTTGIVLDDIRINQPRLLLRRTSEGWNVARLVKEQAQEAEREGPASPIRVGAIGISDGTVEIEDTLAAEGEQRLPRRIARIDLKGGFAYEPVDFSIDLTHLSFRASDPALALNSLSGRVTTRGDDIHVEKLAVRTAESSMQLDAVVRDYLQTPVIEARFGADRLTLREAGPFVPALADSPLQPAVELRVRGPLSAVQSELAVRSDAGELHSSVLAQATTSPMRVKGQLELSHVAAERALPTLPATDLSGSARFDLTLDDARAVRGTVRVTTPAIRVDEYRADAIEANATLEGTAARVEATVRAYGAAVRAGGRVDLPTERTGLAASLEGRVDDLNLARLPRSLEVPALRSDVDARFTADVRLAGTEHRAAQYRGTVSFDRSRLDGATIEAGTVAAAQVGAGAPRFSARGGVRDVDLRRLATALDQPALADPRVDGPIAARFDVEGTGTTVDTLEGTARVQIAEAHLAGGTVRDTEVTATLARGAVEARITGGIEGLDPALASGRSDLAGAVSATLDVRASLPALEAPALDTITAAGSVGIQPSTAGTVTIDGATLVASLDRGQLRIDRLEFASDVARLTARGTAALTRSGDSSLPYTLEVPDLGKAGALVGRQDIGGTMRLEGTLTGNAEALESKGTLTGNTLRYGTTADVVEAEAHYRVLVPDLAPARASGDAQLRATLVRAAGLDIRELTLAAGYADRRATFDTTVREATRRLEARGEAVLGDGRTEVALDRFAIQAGDTVWATTDRATVVHTGDRIDVTGLTMASGSQKLAIDGTVAVGGESPSVPADAAPLSVRAEAVDLAAVDALTGGTRGLVGRLDAEASLAGSLAEPRGRAQITIANGGAGSFRFDRLAATVETDATATRLDAQLDQSPAAQLTITGTLPGATVLQDAEARTAAPIDVRLESSPIPLALAEAMTASIRETQGTLQANVHVTGTLEAPRADGSIRLANGAFTVVPIDTAYRALDANIVLAGDAVTIERFSVADPEGRTLTATGGLGLQGRALRTLDVAVQADGFHVADGRLAQLAVDVDVKVAGGPERLAVTGTVGVEDGRLEIDRLLEQFAPTPAAAEAVETPPPDPEVTGGTGAAAAGTKPEGAPPPAPETVPPSDAPPAGTAPSPPVPPAGATPAPPSLLSNLALDLRLRVPDNLVVRGDGVRLGRNGLGLGDLNMTFGGDIRATQSPGGRPLIVGRIRTIRGFYEFQGRRFELQRDGTIDFRGPDPTNPALDITALREISGIDAIVRVHGTAQQPALELSSRPPLDEADVLSLIIFNRPINDLGTGEQTTLAARAGGLVGGFVAAPVAEALRDALNVDMLEVAAVSEEGGGPSVTIGNQIGERVFIRVRQQFGASSQSALLLEYQLNELFRLQTNVVEGGNDRTPGTTEGSGVDLIFVLRY